MMLDERDVDLLKEFMERYGGSLKVRDSILDICLESRGRREIYQDTDKAAIYAWGKSSLVLSLIIQGIRPSC